MNASSVIPASVAVRREDSGTAPGSRALDSTSARFCGPALVSLPVGGGYLGFATRSTGM
jgi:hypothetical protein